MKYLRDPLIAVIVLIGSWTATALILDLIYGL